MNVEFYDDIAQEIVLESGHRVSKGDTLVVKSIAETDREHGSDGIMREHIGKKIVVDAIECGRTHTSVRTFSEPGSYIWHTKDLALPKEEKLPTATCTINIRPL
jgi:hypothetical protein